MQMNNNTDYRTSDYYIDKITVCKISSEIFAAKRTYSFMKPYQVLKSLKTIE